MMTQSMTRNGVLCLLVAGVAACSSPPPPRPPAVLERVSSTDKAAWRAARDGDWAAARALFDESRRLHQAQDDIAGTGGAIINLATADHRLGNDGQALGLLDGVMRSTEIAYPAALRADAGFRKAVILADVGKGSDAAAALDGAEVLCAKPCALTAGINNLRARLALSTENYAAALKFAQNAGDAARDDKPELANARRYAAAAELALGQNAQAQAHYQAALELDKQLGASGRIAEDLEGAAKALERQGHKEEAASYNRRAAAVRDALHGKPAQGPPQAAP